MDSNNSDRDPRGLVVLRALRSTTGRESTTFGFSILVTVTFGLLQAVTGPPSVPSIFLYAVGAVMSFTVLTGVLSGGFRKPMPQHRTETLTLGTSMNVISVCAGLGVALLLANVLAADAAWPVAAFAATTVYLLLESLETALAERILLKAGDREADEVTP